MVNEVSKRGTNSSLIPKKYLSFNLICNGHFQDRTARTHLCCIVARS